MDGPVLSGGVIALVAVLLWALYFVPSWRGRHQYYAAERNAVRLNQALRVLAETSETPEEVRLELTTRTAHAQQRLAKRQTVEAECEECQRDEHGAVSTRQHLERDEQGGQAEVAPPSFCVTGLVVSDRA